MGKKPKAKSPSTTPEVVDTERATEVAELKRSGNNQFAERDFQKALDTYDKAVKMLPEASAEKADILSNKAACYIQMKRFKEAVRECSAALTSSPGFSKALTRRSRAYESQGLFKQALTDIQQVNRTDVASAETKESEKRLKDLVAGRRPPGSSARNIGTRVPPIVYFGAKCTYEDETRTIHLSHATSYAELLDVVRSKFSFVGPFLIKYQDKDGDLITVSARSDIANAIAEVLTAYERTVSTHSSRLNPQFPPVKFKIVKVESEEQVPVPPEDEVRERKQFIANQRALEKARQAKLAEKRPEAAGEEAVYEIDDWLVDFANLFRERTGIDPDRHVDMHNLGVEKCQKALEAVIHSPEALPIFDEAAEKFKEVTCVGLLNWGNVYLCVGHKIGSEAASQGKKADEVETDILAYFDKAEDRYNEALKYKDDFYDGILALAQLEFERAKIKMGLIVEPPEDESKKESETEAPPTKVPPEKPPTKEPVDEEKAQQAAAQAMNEAMKKALKRVDAAKLPLVQPLIDRSWEIYAKSVKLGIDLDAQREKEKEKKAAKEKAKADGQPDTKTESSAKEENPDEPGLKTHALVMWGNVIFEQSQILAATGGDWKPSLDEAIAKFKEAGCNEKDINQALKTHFKADELDIPELETEEDKQPAGPAKEEEEAPVKGMQSLPPKPKKSVEA